MLATKSVVISSSRKGRGTRWQVPESSPFYFSLRRSPRRPCPMSRSERPAATTLRLRSARYWYQTLIADGAALGIGGYAFSRRGDPYSGDAVSPARLFGTLAHRSVGLPGSGGVGARRCRTNRPRRRLRQRGCRRAYGDGHRCRRPSASTFLEVLSHTSLQQSQGRFGTTTTNPVAPAIDRSSGSRQRGRVRGSHPALWAC